MRVVLIDGEGIWVRGNITFERTSVNAVRILFKDKNGTNHNINLDMVVEIIDNQ